GLRAFRGESRSTLRRFVRTLALDVLVIAAAVIATSLAFDTLVDALAEHMSRSAARVVVVAAAGAVMLPFCVSVLRTTHRFARLFREVAVPRYRADTADLGRQPRLVVEAAIRLVGGLITGSALIAITQPFLRGYTAGIVLAAAIAVLAIGFWRTARGLEGHVR